jgi:hypothetical protein
MCEEGKRTREQRLVFVCWWSCLWTELWKTGPRGRRRAGRASGFKRLVFQARGGSAPFGHTSHSLACITWLGRVWGRDGKLEHSLANHEGAIFALKWNPSVSRREGREAGRQGGGDRRVEGPRMVSFSWSDATFK